MRPVLTLAEVLNASNVLTWRCCLEAKNFEVPLILVRPALTPSACNLSVKLQNIPRGRPVSVRCRLEPVFRLRKLTLCRVQSLFVYVRPLRGAGAETV